MKEIKLEFDRTTLEQYYAYYFALHPRARILPIKDPYHPSINQWMILKRPMMNALKRKWKDFIVWFVATQGYTNSRIDKCYLVFKTYYYTSRPHDVDNSTPKFIIDGLVESGMIVNDDSKHVESLHLYCRIDADRPRTEIKIMIYEDGDKGYEL